MENDCIKLLTARNYSNLRKGSPDIQRTIKNNVISYILILNNRKKG